MAPASTRTQPPALVVMFTGGLAAVMLVSLTAIWLSSRSRPLGCLAGEVCVGPPRGVALIPDEQTWTSRYGFQVEFDGHWTELSRDPSRLVLSLASGGATLTVLGADGHVSPRDLLLENLRALRSSIPTLSPDCAELGAGTESGCPHPEHAVLGANVGYVPGYGGAWAGTTADSGQEEWVVMMSAGTSQASALVTVITNIPEGWDRLSMFGLADRIVNTFLWYPR